MGVGWGVGGKGWGGVRWSERGRGGGVRWSEGGEGVG